MLSLNRVILTGRLKDAPEIRYTPQGHPVTFFTLMLPSTPIREKGFTFEDVAIQVMLVGEDSEPWVKSKGRPGESVLVEGGLVQRRWETSGGRTRREIGIIAHSVKDLH